MYIPVTSAKIIEHKLLRSDKLDVSSDVQQRCYRNKLKHTLVLKSMSYQKHLINLPSFQSQKQQNTFKFCCPSDSSQTLSRRKCQCWWAHKSELETLVAHAVFAMCRNRAAICFFHVAPCLRSCSHFERRSLSVERQRRFVAWRRQFGAVTRHRHHLTDVLRSNVAMNGNDEKYAEEQEDCWHQQNSDDLQINETARVTIVDWIWTYHWQHEKNRICAARHKWSVCK